MDKILQQMEAKRAKKKKKPSNLGVKDNCQCQARALNPLKKNGCKRGYVEGTMCYMSTIGEDHVRTD